MLMWSRNHFNVLMRKKFVKKGNVSSLYDFFYFGENKFSPEKKNKLSSKKLVVFIYFTTKYLNVFFTILIRSKTFFTQIKNSYKIIMVKILFNTRFSHQHVQMLTGPHEKK